MGTDLVIDTHDLSKSYDGVAALDGLDLQVTQNSIFGFLGPNGAGKTTAMKLLLGLSKPTQGRAELFGLDAATDSIAIRRRVGYLAQDPRFYSHMTARETMRFAARFFYRGPRDAVESRIEETLLLVGLDDKADRPVKGFSGGERQRLGIAQAQVNFPDLLILDEPAASLDPMGRRDVLEVMERLRRHATIFYSTHILDDVQRVSDSVAILDHGRLVAQAPIEQLLNSGGEATYLVSVRGDPASARNALEHQSWVTGVTTVDHPQGATLEVIVGDEARADDELLRVVLAPGDNVITQFGRKQMNLEETFLQLVDSERS